MAPRFPDSGFADNPGYEAVSFKFRTLEVPMPYYFIYDRALPVTSIWKIDDDAAMQIGVTNPQGGASTYFECDSDKTIWETLACKVPVWFGPGTEKMRYELSLAPGRYYPRIARPPHFYAEIGLGWNPDNRNAINEIAVTRGQLLALTRQLQRICYTVHPSKDTFSTFGHDIRNLLILACTEVEAHWRAVLLANGYTKPEKYLNRKDYIKLVLPMRLSEYSISFPFYPWIDPIKPFEKWSSADITSDGLNWYDAYNLVKHDRENNFKSATLENAFLAVSACAIMILAQFGDPEQIEQRSELQYFFKPENVPKWSPSEVYLYPHAIHPENNSIWVPKNFSF
jgi:hypothetical protein